MTQEHKGFGDYVCGHRCILVEFVALSNTGGSVHPKVQIDELCFIYKPKVLIVYIAFSSRETNGD